ncbi:VIT domain-containing protein [Aquimarina sp. RZ0]|uniref:VIT domain-containing protein n=1 Tax=Aquimarina sp. RZ0 TaxID=2607730 RepID=UPI0011F25B54|nr:VIT domain-containing protein [Aquimarina sp. RZ0]KAA1245654.1 DUF2135 domain-containing protein [Aquimarina sp. RZ0]
MKKIYTCILSVLLSFLTYAQDIPILKVSDTPVGLSSLDINVAVIGNIATTTYDMLFYNPSNSILEGELSFPLGEGHEVSRFALDVNGKLREAVIVEKELGRIAFEGVVRRGVDPALLEKGSGNNYKARIYPIPANGYKRIVLAYEQELIYTAESHYYNLPLSFSNKLSHFSLNMVVFDQKSKPIIEKGNISGLEFSNWKQNYTTAITKKNYIPNKNVLIKIPISLATEKIITSDNYFYLYKTVKPENRKREKSDQVTIYWDISLSMKNRNLQKELDFLDTYFLYEQDIDVNFITFSNSKLSEKLFSIKNGNWKLLKETIALLVYDGGTSYASIFSEKKTADSIFLFSDGMISLDMVKIPDYCPVFIINSTARANHQTLKNKAEQTNGAYINLQTKSIVDAMNNIMYEPFRFLGYTSKTNQGEIYPNMPVSLSHDFSISGKYFTEGEILELNFGYGNDVTQCISVKIDVHQEKSVDIRRIWAQKKLNFLQKDVENHKNQITALGKTYGLVTDYTSLIVLEDVRDYIAYQIPPPEELLEEYNRILASKDDKVDASIRFQNTIEESVEKTMIEQEFEIVQEEKIVAAPMLRSVENDLEEIIEVEEILDIADEEELLFVPFSLIEQVPVFPGCEENISNDQKKQCFSEKVGNMVSENFNADLGKDLNISNGIQRIYTQFTIDNKGRVTNIMARASHRKLEEEAIRVLTLIPALTPGKQRGIEVDVQYSLPIVFNINSTGNSSIQIASNLQNTAVKPTPFKKYTGDLTIKERKVDQRYITALSKSKNKEEAYKIYLTQRKQYIKIPAYFVDVSNFFRKRYKEHIYADRILSNIPETDFDNYELLKVYGYQLQAAQYHNQAVFIFERVLELRSEDVQSYRDLALAYENIGKCQEALDLLNSIISGEIYKNSKRRVFVGIKNIAKNEIRTLIHKYKKDLDISKIDKHLLKPVTYDIRVTTDWNHNDTDIDLHIIDPNLEECYYSHNRTSIGGHISEDMTQGFGPEEFTLKDAIKGTYYVKIKYYGDQYQKNENPTFMKVTMFKNYGTSKEIKNISVIRLTKKDNEEMIATIEI